MAIAGGGVTEGGINIEYYSASFWQLQSIFFYIFSTYVHFFGPTTPKGNL